MNAKDIIFEVLESQYGKEGITKLIIRKLIEENKTLIVIAFKEGKCETIEPDFKDRKTLDFVLLNKIKRSIKNTTGETPVEVDLFIKLDTKSLEVLYKTKEIPEYKVFNQ